VNHDRRGAGRREDQVSGQGSPANPAATLDFKTPDGADLSIGNHFFLRIFSRQTQPVDLAHLTGQRFPE